MKGAAGKALAVILVVGAMYVLLVGLPGTRTELARRGVREIGEVQLVDTQAGPGGASVHTVTFIFADTMKRNHQVTRAVYDTGLWQRLKPGSEVAVYFLPEKPDQASIAGAEGYSAPAPPSVRFVAWTALVAGIVLAVRVFRPAPVHSAEVGPRPPRVTVARR
ncbi:MAG: hypothetical protein IT208_01490 [Chthonomonadales bacterium]|nr:hypothetical protein [Chthonomonadales bacterium]